MSNHIEDAWGSTSPFISETRAVIVHNEPAEPEAASARVAVADSVDDDGKEGGGSTSVDTAAFESIVSELKMMRNENSRQSQCIMALLALQGVMLFIYLDRLRSYHRLREMSREVL